MAGVLKYSSAKKGLNQAILRCSHQCSIASTLLLDTAVSMIDISISHD